MSTAAPLQNTAARSQPGRVHSMHQTTVNMMNDGIVTNINKNNWLGVGT